MTIDVRAVESRAEYDEAFQCIGQYFGLGAFTDERYERFAQVLPHDRMLAAREEGTIVGGAGSFGFDLSVPGGGRVPCAGVTVVGVYPSHRRRGVLRALMREQLDDAHRRGEPLAALWASEETIYGRFGYGIASWCGSIELPHVHDAFAQPFERRGRVRIVDADEAKQHLPEIWERARDVRPGTFARSDAWWDTRAIADPEYRREPGQGPKRFALYEVDGEVRGYAIYRHKPGFRDAVSSAELVVVEAVGADDQATREVWRFLLDIDWAATVTADFLPPDHPLFLLLAEPRRLRYKLYDALWVRLVDVGAALSQRTYGEGDPLVLEVADDFCPWNEGRWHLAEGRAERTDDEPDVKLGAAALGSAYLGGVAFAQLAAASRAEEVSPGALARADELFRAPLHPWTPEIF